MIHLERLERLALALELIDQEHEQAQAHGLVQQRGTNTDNFERCRSETSEYIVDLLSPPLENMITENWDKKFPGGRSRRVLCW